MRNSVYGHIPRCRATNRRVFMGDNVVRITKVRRPAVRLAVAPARPSCFLMAATCPGPPLAPPGCAGQSKYAKFQKLGLKSLSKCTLSSSNWDLVHIPTSYYCMYSTKK